MVQIEQDLSNQRAISCYFVCPDNFVLPCNGRQETFGSQQIAHKSMHRVLAGKHNGLQQPIALFVAHRVKAVWNQGG